MEILLVLNGLDVNRSAEAKLISIKEGDIGGEIVKANQSE